MLAGPVFMIATHLTLVATGQVPDLNVKPSCRGAARVTTTVQPDFETCMRQERASRKTLKQRWKTYSAGTRAHCVELSTLGGLPSYTELLTCLEIAHDAKQQKSGMPVKGTVSHPR